MRTSHEAWTVDKGGEIGDFGSGSLEGEAQPMIGGGAFIGWASPWECRAAQSCPARAEEAQGAPAGATILWPWRGAFERITESSRSRDLSRTAL